MKDGLHIVVEMSEADCEALGLNLNESRWRPAPVPGYMQRVDPARPEMHQRRHVHIARNREVLVKHKQVSWNDDGSRHDRKSFNQHFQKLEIAKQIARAALRLPPDSILEAASRAKECLLLIDGVLSESTDSATHLDEVVLLVLQ